MKIMNFINTSTQYIRDLIGLIVIIGFVGASVGPWIVGWYYVIKYLLY